MRKAPMLLALAAAATAAPALAQVQQSNPNAANRALANEGQARALQQNQAGQTDMMQMNVERNQMSAPPPPGGTVVGRPGPAGIP